MTTNIVSVVSLLSKTLNSNEILIYCYVLQYNENEEKMINLNSLFNIFTKNKTIDVLKSLAKRKIISGSIEENILELENIIEPCAVQANDILEAVVTSEKKGGNRIANSGDVRELIMVKVPEEESTIARKLIRKLIEICVEINVSNHELNNYIKDRIKKGDNWKNILSSYELRQKFDKNFSVEEIE